MTIYERIKSLEAIQRSIRDCQKEYRLTSLPLFTDASRIGEVYDYYSSLPEVLSMRDKVEVRKVFSFVVLSIYCPKFLSGQMITRGGLRKEIAKVLNCTPNLISIDCRDTLFRYAHYRYVRKEIDSIYEKILRYLEENTTK